MPASMPSVSSLPHGALLWERVDGVVGRASTLGDLRAHGLQLLAAARSRRLGQRPPAETAELENAAAMRVLAVEHLLRRIREVCDGQLVLMKGYEIALRYPDAVQRPFGDIDLLAPDPWRAYGQLRAAGFEPIGLGDAYYADRHHLQPLALPSLPVPVELHRMPQWVRWSRAPRAEELVEHAVASRTGIDGLLAPAPAHHALVVAAHSWAGLPLRRVVDLLDAALLADEAEPGEVERWARAWDVEGVWEFTTRVQASLFAGAPAPRAARVWGRGALEVRDLTVVEQHARRLLSPLAVLPARRALLEMAVSLVREVTPRDDEGWRAKTTRAGIAVRNAFRDRSGHEAALRRRS